MSDSYLKSLDKAMRAYAKTHTLCPKCFGVGCLPKNFEMGNPDAKPCYKCRGKGFLNKGIKCL